MPEIIVCQNSKNYHVISFDQDISIGRDSNNGIKLLSPQVSRKHARIQKEDGLYRLVDLNSTNSVWLGAEKVQSLELVHGSTFRIADFFLTFIDEQTKFSHQLVLEDENEEEKQGANETMLSVSFNLQEVDTPEELELITAARKWSSKVQTLQKKDEDELLDEALRAIINQTGSEAGFIALRDSDHELVYRATENFDPYTDNRHVHHATVKLVISEGNAVIVNKHDQQVKKGAHVLCTPLMQDNEPTGCCYCFRQHSPYLARDKHISQLVMLITSSHLPDQKTEEDKEDITLNNSEKGRYRKNIIIKSQNMVNLYHDVQTIAPINVPALILGEPGTGKEMVAEELHNCSRRKGAFITLNCSAIPEGIFESELFGSVKGAYQDAQNKPGKLELADNGTLFLDEIGDMALSLQPKLLRFLENQEVTRLGDTRVRKLNVRVVAATNQNLQEMIEKRTFRADLFQRLSCFSLKIPPLVERGEDIELLVRFFLEKFSQEYGWGAPRILPKAMEMLAKYNWPGNVRELRNVSLRMAVHFQGKAITPEDITRHFDEFEGHSPKKVAAFPTLEQMEKNHMYDALQEASWNISDASKLLGIARSTFYKKMEKYDITLP
ncbi:MAG: hypothetical protein CSA20_08045 [Deltaproteobacteria bacterium]|nr:MAG: hypothetical protein CSA20_08045 [Deltaproteobacteria bacterium]